MSVHRPFPPRPRGSRRLSPPAEKALLNEMRSTILPEEIDLFDHLLREDILALFDDASPGSDRR